MGQFTRGSRQWASFASRAISPTQNELRMIRCARLEILKMTPINALLADSHLDSLGWDTFRNDTSTMAHADGDYCWDPDQPWPPQ
jgi:hypothetical protein